MTAPDLAAIKARAAAATEGPWTVRPGSAFQFSRVIARRVLRYGNSADEVISDGPHGQADATFIAHARTDVPALLAEVERLRAAVERVTAKAERTARAATEDYTEPEAWRAFAADLRAALTPDGES